MEAPNQKDRSSEVPVDSSAEESTELSSIRGIHSDYSKWASIVLNAGQPTFSLEPLRSSSILSSNPANSIFSISSELESERVLKQKIADLENDVIQLGTKLKGKEGQLKGTSAEAKEWKDKFRELDETTRLAQILSRVPGDAKDMVKEQSASKKGLFSSEARDSFVISIDIRRSTELMLKARNHEHFAKFMATVSSDFRSIVLQHNGIFDKFTGDGVLAVFPKFFTGKDAGFHALQTALECHQYFAGAYKNNRRLFNTVLNDVGLGIGIDYGDVHFVSVNANLEMVGTPIVYACRMGGAPSGCTYVNQPAYEELSGYNSFYWDEVELDLKHEGRVAAYSAKPTGKLFDPGPPSWRVASEE